VDLTTDEREVRSGGLGRLRQWTAVLGGIESSAQVKKFTTASNSPSGTHQHNCRSSHTTMDSNLIKRPVLSLVTYRRPCLPAFSTSSRRHEQSYRRAKQRLSVPPNSSFLPSRDSPQNNHIIFNPPSAAPSVFNTPLKFLPKEDKRRQLLAATQARLATPATRLPPPVKPKQVPHHHLSDADIAEIQRLKREEGSVWTNKKLARRFNCSTMFVSICACQSGADDSAWRASEKARLDLVKQRWGPRRAMAHEDKLKRMEIALRDA
jgi:hypothetical protein